MPRAKRTIQKIKVEAWLEPDEADDFRYLQSLGKWQWDADIVRKAIVELAAQYKNKEHEGQGRKVE